MQIMNSSRCALVAAVCGILLALPVSATATNWNVAATIPKGGQAASSVFVVAPTGVSESCGSLFTPKITVSWTASTGATGYKIYVSTTSSSSGFTLAASGVSGTSWTSGTLTNATYWYSVSATYGSGGETSATVSSNSRTISFTLLCT